MSNPFFQAVRYGNLPIGDGSAGDLVSWLEDYVQALFPDNGIEYWARNDFTDSPLDLRQKDRVPIYGMCPNCFVASGCWVTQGMNEGRLIQIYLIRKDFSLARLAWIKTFDSEEQCWQIARALQHALEEYLRFQGTPIITEIFRSLPSRKQRADYDLLLTTELTIEASPAELLLKDKDNRVYYAQKTKGPSREFLASAYVTDCRKVLRSLNLNFTEVLSAEVQALQKAT